MSDKSAVLFDVDGTLVDTNYLHVYAWARAFREAGIAVEAWRIHRCIGMDGARLMESLSGDADEDARQRAEDLHLRYLLDAAPLVAPLPGTRELLAKIREHDIAVVLASSAGEDELAMSRRALDCDDLVSAATSSKDADVGHAVYVGDAVWDVIACRRAGVPAIGLLSGGISREELETAGAQAIFDNPLDLCDNFADTTIAKLSN